MKKILVSLLILGTMLTPASASAQGLSLKDLVGLFLSLGIISPDKAEQATNVASTLDSFGGSQLAQVTPPPPPASDIFPVGGEVLRRGTSYTFKWGALDYASSVKVKLYSTTASIYTIGDYSANKTKPTSKAWTISTSAIPKDDYTIEICSTKNTVKTCTYGKRFSVVKSGAPTLTIASPNGGETILNNSNLSINWTAPNLSLKGRFVVYLESADGTRTLINKGVRQDLTSAMTGTNVLIPAPIIPAQYKVYVVVEEYSNSAYSFVTGDASNGPLNIVSSTSGQWFTLSAAKNGSGTVSGGSINCGSVCSTVLSTGSQISLSATPSYGSLFTGWSGACTGTGACVVTIDGAKNVTATFNFDPSVPLRISLFGDWHNRPVTEANLRNARDNSDLLVGLGDFSYVNGESQTAYCDLVKRNLGNVPMVVLAGDHDNLEKGVSTTNGIVITDLMPCFPLKPDSSVTTGIIGAENYPYRYYLDLRGGTRLIVAGGIGLKTGLSAQEPYADNAWHEANYAGDYNWALNSPIPVGQLKNNYNWLRDTIDSARANGVKHIIVANHEPCLDISETTYNRNRANCTDVMDLMIEKGVDMFIHASKHHYWRSKQIGYTAMCPEFFMSTSPTGVHPSATCVKESVETVNGTQYTKGAGLVHLTVGTGGADPNGCSIATSQSDNEYGFAQPNTCTLNASITILTIDGMKISGVQKLATDGGIHDKYFIQPSTVTPPPPPTLSVSCAVSPTSVVVGQSVTWAVSSSGGSGAYTYSWSGTDGLTGNAVAVTKSYPTIGTKTASVTVVSGTQVVTQTCSNTVSVTDGPILPPPPPLPAGPIAHWRLDGNANDSVGTNNGTVSGATFVAGKISNGASLNGSGYIKIPNAVIGSKTNFTVAGWFKVPSVTTAGLVFFSERNTQNADSQVKITVNNSVTGDVRLRVEDNSAVRVDLYAGVTNANVNWHHVAAVRSGNVWQLYLDGVKKSEVTQIIGLTTLDNVCIGANCVTPTHSAPDNSFNGIVDEVRVYDRSLSGADISALYSAVALGPTPSGVDFVLASTINSLIELLRALR